MTIQDFYKKFKIFEENRLLGLKEVATNEIIIPATCQSIHLVRPYYCSEELYLKVKINEKYSLFTLLGARISGEYEYIGEYSRGIVPFSTNRKWGFLNTVGKVCIFPNFTRVERLAYGLFKVQVNYKWGIVSVKGLEIQPIYEDIIFGNEVILGKINGKFEEIKF